METLNVKMKLQGSEVPQGEDSQILSLCSQAVRVASVPLPFIHLRKKNFAHFSACLPPGRAWKDITEQRGNKSHLFCEVCDIFCYHAHGAPQVSAREQQMHPRVNTRHHFTVCTSHIYVTSVNTVKCMT